MTAYYLLIAWILVLGMATSRRDANTRNTVVVLGASAAIVLLQAVRAFTVGVDLISYIPAYRAAASLDLAAGARLFNYDIAYLYYSKLFSSLGVGPQLYLGIVATTIMTPIAMRVWRYSSAAWLSLLLYVTLGFFVFTFSGLRQSIALAICFFSIRFIADRRIPVFLLLVVLATTFHKSAAVFVLAYPLYHMRRLDARGVLAVVGGLTLVYGARVPLFGLLYRLYSGISGVSDTTGAFGMLIGMLAVYVLAYAFSDPEDQVAQGYCNLLLAAIALQVFAGQSNVVMRAGYYYFIPVILLIPRVIATQKEKSARLLVTYVVCVAAIMFFQWKTASGYLNVSPYTFFWN